MKIRRLRVSNFRGFESLEFIPRAHVFVVGQPGAGRSDLVSALWRVLCADSCRSHLTDELDFFNRDLDRRIEIEVVLGSLGPQLENTFFDRLELWNPGSEELVDELDQTALPDPAELENVVRLCYRAAWDASEQLGRQWVDFPKFSDVEAEDFRNVPVLLREQLPVHFVHSGGSILSLASRGDLRKLVDESENGDFAESLTRVVEQIAELSDGLVRSSDLSESLEKVITPLRVPLNLGTRPASEVIRFAPEGGSLAGLLRGLQPILKLREELGFIPVSRHGSTLQGLLRLAQAVAEAASRKSVVVADDFADSMDTESAVHVAATLRAHADQVWLSTRLGPVGQCFRPEEILRLTVSHEGKRSIHVGQTPQNRSERAAARHLQLQILPAVSARTIAILEGVHDRASLVGASLKLNVDEGVPLPAAHRIAIIDAGGQGSGGIDNVPKLARLAKQLGFHVVSVIDWDNDPEMAATRLRQARETSDVVIRWPQGHAIELALLHDLADEVVRSTLVATSSALEIPLGFEPETLNGDELRSRAVRFLKSAGGLHAVFLEALPKGGTPPLLRSCIDRLNNSTGEAGLVQL